MHPFFETQKEYLRDDHPRFRPGDTLRVNDGILSPPSYTRPAEFRGVRVPEVLLSGDHARIAGWRREQAERLTRERRPELWQGREEE